MRAAGSFAIWTGAPACQRDRRCRARRDRGARPGLGRRPGAAAAAAAGRQPVRRLRPAARRGLSGTAAGGAAGKRHHGEPHRGRRLRRYHRRRPRPSALGAGGGPEQQPDAALVELGGNDVLRGFAPATTEANLDRILATFGERRIPVLLVGMRAPPNLGADYVKAFDAIFPRLAAKHGVPLYPFFLDGVAGNPALNQPDGIHPNGAGVQIIVERILPDVRALLAGRQAPPG
ncbi:MAG: GDSL-type esterase/lipase family protein [Rhodospirillales bacterium]